MGGLEEISYMKGVLCIFSMVFGVFEGRGAGKDKVPQVASFRYVENVLNMLT